MMMGFAWMGISILGVLVLAIIMVRALFPQTQADMLDSARKRLAKGEISIEEFERLRHELS